MNRGLANIKKTDIIIDRPVSSDELNKLEQCIFLITDFDKHSNKFQLAREALLDLLSGLKTNRQKSNDIPRKIIELMTLFKAFLDHWQKLISDKFGCASSKVEQFKLLVIWDKDIEGFIAGLSSLLHSVAYLDR